MRISLLKQRLAITSFSLLCKYSVVCLYIYLLNNHQKQLQKGMNLIELCPAHKTALLWLLQNWTKDHNIKPLKRKEIVPSQYKSEDTKYCLDVIMNFTTERNTRQKPFLFSSSFFVVLSRFTYISGKMNYKHTSPLYYLIHNFKTLALVSYKCMKGSIFQCRHSMMFI